jgi:hypothetical protein
MTRQSGDPNELPPAILGGVVATEEMTEKTREPEDERLEKLPEHEDDRARGATGSTGAGVAGIGGTSDEGHDTSRLPRPDETA